MGVLIVRSSLSAGQDVGNYSFVTNGDASGANSPAIWIPRTGAANIGASTMTVELWIAPSATTSYNSRSVSEGANYLNATAGNIVVDGDDTTNGGCYILGLATGRPYFGVNANSQYSAVASTAPDLRDGNWHHVVWQRTASSGLIEMWVDGTRYYSANRATGSVAWVSGGNTTDQRTYFMMEKLEAGGWGCHGLLSEVRLSTSLVYSGATIAVPTAPLTGGVALYHFASGNTLADSSGNNITATVRGSPGPSWGSADPFGGA